MFWTGLTGRPAGIEFWPGWRWRSGLVDSRGCVNLLTKNDRNIINQSSSFLNRSATNERPIINGCLLLFIFSWYRKRSIVKRSRKDWISNYDDAKINVRILIFRLFGSVLNCAKRFFTIQTSSDKPSKIQGSNFDGVSNAFIYLFLFPL